MVSITKLILIAGILFVVVGCIIRKNDQKWNKVVQLDDGVNVNNMYVYRDVLYISGHFLTVQDRLRVEDVDKMLNRADTVFYAYNLKNDTLKKYDYGKGVLLQSVMDQRTGAMVSLGFSYDKGKKRSFIIKQGRGSEHNRIWLPSDFLEIDINGSDMIGSDGRLVYMSHDNGTSWQISGKPEDIITAFPVFGFANTYGYAANDTLFIAGAQDDSAKVAGRIHMVRCDELGNWFVLWSQDVDGSSTINLSMYKQNTGLKLISSFEGLMPKLFRKESHKMVVVGSKLSGIGTGAIAVTTADDGKTWKVADFGLLHTRTFAISGDTLYGVSHEHSIVSRKIAFN